MIKKIYILNLLVITLLMACKPTIICSTGSTSEADLIISELTDDYGDGDLTDVRIRGYILPAESLTTIKSALSVSPGIIGENQKYLHLEVYQMFIDGFNDMLKNGYDYNLLATQAKATYKSGAKVTFDPNTYTLVIDGSIVSFLNEPNSQGIRAENLLTKNKTWRLSDISWLDTTVSEFPPQIGSQYYILWMLEGYIWSNERDKMIVRIIGQDKHHLSLYTVVE